MGFVFDRADIIDKVVIRHLLAGRYLVARDAEYSVCATDLFICRSRFSYALYTASKFVGKGCCPYVAIRATDKFVYDSFSPSDWMVHVVGNMI